MKWEWASRVLWFLLFLMSHILRVLSSEALRIYLPPGWNTSPLTQLSCPVCTKIQRGLNLKYQPWKQSFLKMNLVVMALKKIFQKEHWKVDNHLHQDLIKDNYLSFLKKLNLNVFQNKIMVLPFYLKFPIQWNIITYQSEQTQSHTNVPHLDCFVTWSRYQKWTRSLLLLVLK